MPRATYVAVIDQGTTSTRCILFDHGGNIVWQDTRTDRIVNELASGGGQDRFRPKTGFPLATYFSGPKARWILDHVPGARAAAEHGELLFGSVDTFLDGATRERLYHDWKRAVERSFGWIEEQVSA